MAEHKALHTKLSVYRCSVCPPLDAWHAHTIVKLVTYFCMCGVYAATTDIVLTTVNRVKLAKNKPEFSLQL